MSRLIHLRGDILGMFIFFLWFFVGLWQIVIAWKRLNGLSLTGYPDRRWVSLLLGVAVAAGACVWYFSGRRHFASPDLEGIETLIVMGGGLVGATIIECALAQVAAWLRMSFKKASVAPAEFEEAEAFIVDVEGAEVPAQYVSSTGGLVPLLVLHDYGGSQADVGALAAFMASLGHPAMSVDLDGHGRNPREIADPGMEALLGAACSALAGKAGSDAVSIVGVGLGGTLAMACVGKPGMEKAVAIDPPARSVDGFPETSSLRELHAADILAGFFRSPARAREGKRLSYSRLLALMGKAEPGRAAALIGTRDKWFNDPAELRSLGEPVAAIASNHQSLAGVVETFEAVAEAVASGAV